MGMLFNEQGFLDIDEMIANEMTFRRIMEDGVVTDDELRQQSKVVIDLLYEVEQRFNEEDQQLVKKLFAEASVLSTIYRFYELNNLRT